MKNNIKQKFADLKTIREVDHVGIVQVSEVPDKKFDLIYEPFTQHVYGLTVIGEQSVLIFKKFIDQINDDFVEELAELTGWKLAGDLMDRRHAIKADGSFLDLSGLSDFVTMGDNSSMIMRGHLLSSHAGVVGMLGKGGAGKSHLMRKMFAADRDKSRDPVWISFTEKFEKVLVDEDIVSPSDYPAQGTSDMMDKLMANIMLAGRFNEGTFAPSIYLDGLRRALYDTAGSAAGKGGMNNQLVLNLTELSNICLARKVTLVVSLNPMIEDADMDFIYQRLIASIAVAVFIEDKTKGNVHLREGRQDVPLNTIYETVVDDDSKIGKKSDKTEDEQPDDVATSGSTDRNFGRGALPQSVRALGRQVQVREYAAKTVRK